MNFELVGQLPIHDLKRAVIANSQTLAVGDAIVSGAGAASEFVSKAANTAARIVGVVTSIQQPNTVLEVNSITVESDNQTDKLVYVEYIPTYVPVEYKGLLDDDAGTTTGSEGIGFFTLTTSSGLLDESTWVAYSGTASHFASFGADANDLTHVTGHFFLTF